MILEQSGTSDFETPVIRYSGSDGSSVLTGLPEGTHHFRVKLVEGTTWSKPIQVVVEFFPRNQLVLLLSLGGFVALSTIGAVVVGFLKTKNEEEAK